MDAGALVTQSPRSTRTSQLNNGRELITPITAQRGPSSALDSCCPAADLLRGADALAENTANSEALTLAAIAPYVTAVSRVERKSDLTATT